MKRVLMVVEGRVQGVGYRYFVQRQAEVLGISGFVRNLYDGRVEIEAEASRTTLNQFTDACKQGPSMARVDKCYQSELPFYGYRGFRIKT
jgi:acylphosphatase